MSLIGDVILLTHDVPSHSLLTNGIVDILCCSMITWQYLLLESKGTSDDESLLNTIAFNIIVII